jgi:hypothetical protein
VTRTVIKIRPEQLGAALTSAAQNASQAVQKGLYLGAERAVAHLKKTSKVDRGQYKNAWRHRSLPGGSRQVLNDAPHAGIVERGARPHPVSAAGWMAIFRWVLRHLPEFGVSAKAARMTTRALSSRRSKSSGAVSWTVEEATRITNAIVNKIRTRGQEPTWQVRDSMPKLAKFLNEELQRAITSAVKRGGRP